MQSGIATAGFRFGVLTAVSAASNLGVTAFLHEVLGLRAEIAYAIALAFVVVQNFLGMRYYVYPGSGTSWQRQFAEFLGATLGFRGLEFLFFFVQHEALGIHYLVAAVSTMVVFFVVKFVFYRFAVFSR